MAAGAPALEEVGFWCPVSDVGAGAPAGASPSRPDPTGTVDGAWAAAAGGRAVAAYAAAGAVESWELAPAPCRFRRRVNGVAGGGGGGAAGAPRAAAGEDGGCAAPPATLGCATLTDGVYVWPESLAHYITAHGVRPPGGFVAHALAVTSALAAGSPPGPPPPPATCLNCVAFDAGTGELAPLPRGTREYLAVHSSLDLRGGDDGGGDGEVVAAAAAVFRAARAARVEARA
jgi:hypothetical protein